MAFAMQESACNPGATGAGGSAGLLQLSPVSIALYYNNVFRLDLTSCPGQMHLFKLLRRINESQHWCTVPEISFGC